MKVGRMYTGVSVDNEDDRDSWPVSPRSSVLPSTPLPPTLFILRRFARHCAGDDDASVAWLLTVWLGDDDSPSTTASCNIHAQLFTDAPFQQKCWSSLLSGRNVHCFSLALLFPFTATKRLPQTHSSLDSAVSSPAKNTFLCFQP